MRLAAVLLVLCVVSAKVIDVKPTQESRFFWGLAEYDDMTVKQGDTVHFKSANGFHDLALVSTRKHLDECILDDAEFVVPQDLESSKNGVLEKGDYLWTFKYEASEAGEFHFVCTVGEGSHCRIGQKFTLTVLDEEGDGDVQVLLRDTPYWTVAVGYEDLEVDLGDSLFLPSDNEGFHDLVLLNPETCPDYSCCTMGGLNMDEHVLEVLYDQDDYRNDPSYTWTPPEAGHYMVACSIYAGGHCQFGQKFSVTVHDNSCSDDKTCPDGKECECGSRRLLWGASKGCTCV